MLAAVWINAVAVSFDADDFTENLFRFNGFIKVVRRIAAKNEKKFLG